MVSWSTGVASACRLLHHRRRCGVGSAGAVPVRRSPSSRQKRNRSSPSSRPTAENGYGASSSAAAAEAVGTSATTASAAAEAEAAATAIAAVPPKIARHGPGDGVIFLNVGGKEFTTLRSTVRINPILWRHVAMAERNNEFTKGAVFIDRDPARFGLILQHLRNRASNIDTWYGGGANKLFGLKAGSKGRCPSSSVTIPIPKDQEARHELFMEARYFRIQEIEDVLCAHDLRTRLASLVGGGAANPFVAASGLLKNMRRFLFATGGTSLFMGSMNDDLRKDAAKLLSDLKLLASGGGGGSPNAAAADAPASPEPSL